MEHPEVTDFITYLHLKNLASSTIKGYRLALKGLFDYIELGASAPSQITAAQLRDYVASLYDRGLAPKTIKNYVVGIKRFFGFLLVEGYIEDEVVFDGVAPLVHNKFEAHHSNDAVVVRHQVVEESGIAVLTRVESFLPPAARLNRLLEVIAEALHVGVVRRVGDVSPALFG